ncbi:MAG: tRNA (guanosine(46)-N7)-methyltransferase TrmB [Acidiferrobacterales bacterium]
MIDASKVVRPIRSYVRREGRITRAQRRALSELWPKYGVDDDPSALDFAALFRRRAPVAMEIGFGNGEVLCRFAQSNPAIDYLGVEVHRPGIGSLLLKLEQHAVNNVRVICADATLVLAQRVPEGSLEAVYLLFPDPWPKKRHHKRRLVQKGFLEEVQRRLRPGGRLHIATDWREYAEHAAAAATQVQGLINASGAEIYAPRPASCSASRFERRGQELGHQVWDLIYERVRE